MSLSNNLGAYEDCVKIFDMALQSNKGVRIGGQDLGDVHHMYVRLHYARTLLRTQSMGNLPSDHPDWGTSQYDVLIVRRPKEVDGKWWIYVEWRSTGGWLIEELTDADTTPG